MATARPFAYNTGAPISGTTQTGDLAVGVSDEPYSDNYGGVIWWNGPDEELGYVIELIEKPMDKGFDNLLKKNNKSPNRLMEFRDVKQCDCLLLTYFYFDNI